MTASRFYVPPLASQDQYIQNVAIQQLAQKVTSLTSTSTAATSSLKAVSPKDYGAFGDGNSHPITAADVTAHSTIWIGPFNQNPLTTYPIGTEWDVVGIQEAIYAAFANTSTPGNIIWNSTSNGTTNFNFFCPGGTYRINRRIWLAAQGFTFEFEDRLNTAWQWFGYPNFTCNSHSSTTLDGISASDIANLYVGMYVFDARIQLGVGSIPASTYITAVGSSSVTLNKATTSTVTGLIVQPQSSMLQCDSVAYGNFRNLNLEAQAQILEGNALTAGPTVLALLVVDNSGVISMLSPQQLTFYDLAVFGNLFVDYCVAMIPRGGGGQGDTILYVNPFISTCFKAGIVISGNNALSHQFINGDFQQCYGYGILCTSGSFYVYGTSLQNQLANFNFSPQVGQITAVTADMFCGAGAGFSSTCGLHDIRSEASVGVISQNLGMASNYALAGADMLEWVANFPFQALSTILPSVNNAKGRSLCCVDNGGEIQNTWHLADPTSSGDTLVVLGTSPGWTVNQWVGFSLFFRFGSNGFTAHFSGQITSNTANSVTATGTGVGSSATPTTMFSIGGLSAAVEPNWDSASSGNFAFGQDVSAGQGFSITAGSKLLSVSSEIGSLNIGDYVVIPGGELFGTPGGGVPQLVIPYVAGVASTSTSTAAVSYNMTRAPSYTLPFTKGWYGTPINDNGTKWLEIPFNSFSGLKTLIDCLGTNGIVTNCFGVMGLESTRADTLFGAFNATPSNLTAKNNLSLDGGPVASIIVALAQAATVDLTSPFQKANIFSLTPNQSSTLNAPTPAPGIAHEVTFIFIAGNTFTITFGTNFKSSGALALGAVAGKYWIVKFVADGTNYIEIARSGPL